MTGTQIVLPLHTLGDRAVMTGHLYGCVTSLLGVLSGDLVGEVG